MDRKKIYAIGLMSGTSLDGLDLAYCRFSKKKKKWSYKIKASQTIAYRRDLKTKLSHAHKLSGEELMLLHSAYGQWIGKACQTFIKQNKISRIDLIASHGHTVFHQPKNRFTFQLGDGNSIHAQTGIPVVYDFRSLDVHLGGEGAPLVPVGDQLLFNNYDVCLNLGGIANLSMEKNKQRVAFDICYVNMALNFLAAQAKKEFDRDGKMASEGNINLRLLHQLQLPYKKTSRSRPSLSRELFEVGFLKLLSNKKINLADRMRTYCEFVAERIVVALPTKNKVDLLVTGGGAKNKFLVGLISEKLKKRAKVTVPDSVTIDYKEAMIFGFLGALNVLGKENTLMTATHSKRDSCAGVLVGAKYL